MSSPAKCWSLHSRVAGGGEGVQASSSALSELSRTGQLVLTSEISELPAANPSVMSSQTKSAVCAVVRGASAASQPATATRVRAAQQEGGRERVVSSTTIVLDRNHIMLIKDVPTRNTRSKRLSQHGTRQLVAQCDTGLWAARVVQTAWYTAVDRVGQ